MHTIGLWVSLEHVKSRACSCQHACCPSGPSPSALLVPERSARASGFLTDQFGSDQGNPALGNTYSVYFNPAAMAGMRGTELTLDGVMAARSLDYNRTAAAASYSGSSPADAPAYAAANTGQAHLFNVLGAPYVGFVTDFGGSNLRLGVASYIPFGGEATWSKNKQFASPTSVDPGAYDGPQRWSSIAASTSSLYETAALAYRFDKARLGLGASVSVIRTGLTDTRAHNADGSDDIVNGAGALKEGRSYLDVSGLQVGAAAGLYWEATQDRKLRIGVSYTSQPNFGTMRLGGTFKFTPGAFGSESTTNVDLQQAYPDVVRIGAAWRVTSQTEIRLDGDWERWSQFKDQCIVNPGTSCNASSSGVVLPANGSNVVLDLPRDWKDSMKVRLGVGLLGHARDRDPRERLVGVAARRQEPRGPAHLRLDAHRRHPRGTPRLHQPPLRRAQLHLRVPLAGDGQRQHLQHAPAPFDVPFDERELLVGALHLRRVDDVPLLTGRSSRPHRVRGVGLFAAAAFPAPTPRMTRDGDEPSPTGVWALV